MILLGILSRQGPAGYWEQVSTGETISFPSGTHYYDGTNNTGNRSPKPRVAIVSDGSDYFINSFSSVWISNMSPFPHTGVTLPPGPTANNLFFNTSNSTLYRWVST